MDPKDEPKSTLTPPASEEADKHDDSGSELSELELESDDNAEIVPDHYYDGGKVPVFKPVSTHDVSLVKQCYGRLFSQHWIVTVTGSMLMFTLPLRQWINFAASNHSSRRLINMA